MGRRLRLLPAAALAVVGLLLGAGCSDDGGGGGGGTNSGSDSGNGPTGPTVGELIGGESELTTTTAAP